MSQEPSGFLDEVQNYIIFLESSRAVESEIVTESVLNPLHVGYMQLRGSVDVQALIASMSARSVLTR